MHDLRAWIIDGNAHHLCIEGVTDLLANQFIDGLHIQLACETGLDAIDNGQLGCALPGFLKQTGIFQGNCQTRSQCSEKTHVRLAEQVGAPILHGKDTDHLLPAPDGNAKPGLGTDRLTHLCEVNDPIFHLLFCSSQYQRLSRSNNGGSESRTQRRWRLREALPCAVDQVGELDHLGLWIIQRNVYRIIVRDPLLRRIDAAYLVSEQVNDCLRVELGCQPLLYVIDNG